jgi:flagellar basal-body rod protein FlgB
VSFLDSTQLSLEAAMRGSMMRQTLLTNNLANADTPGYQPEDVDFQGTLASAMQSGQSAANVTFTPYVEQQTTANNGNGVSTEQASAAVAENALLYQELTEVAGAREQILKSAMGTA